MKAKVNLTVEILDGPDKGYIIEEHNKVLNLVRDNTFAKYAIEPYQIHLEFVTPNIFREYHEANDGPDPYWKKSTDCEGKTCSYTCSKCGFEYDGWDQYAFCPGCGKRMNITKETDDEDELCDDFTQEDLDDETNL